MATDTSSVDLVSEPVVSHVVRAALLAALTGVAAQVAIPIPLSPVPVTLQVLIVFLAGLYLGPVWGPVSMVLYLAAGAAGAPVFAYGSAGVGVLVGESAGYLWSYPIAAGLVGLAVHRPVPRGRGVDPTDAGDGRSIPAWTGDLRDPATASLPVVLAALVLAVLVIYAGGVGYVMWLLDLSAAEALAGYAAWFVPGELLKIAAAIAIVRSGVVPT